MEGPYHLVHRWHIPTPELLAEYLGGWARLARDRLGQSRQQPGLSVGTLVVARPGGTGRLPAAAHAPLEGRVGGKDCKVQQYLGPLEAVAVVAVVVAVIVAVVVAAVAAVVAAVLEVVVVVVVAALAAVAVSCSALTRSLSGGS